MQNPEDYDKELKEGLGFDKKKFNLSVKEFSKLSAYDAIQQAGAFAQAAINQHFNQVILPRVGITPSPDTKLLYDLNDGSFVVYVPPAKKLEEAVNEQATPAVEPTKEESQPEPDKVDTSKN